MKKTFVLLAASVITIVSCGNPSNTSSNPDNKNLTVPGDSAKIDTVKPTDSIIKG